MGTVVHEIGHAIGFFHEQSRSDRDNHITVLFENMDAQMRGQFEKQDDMNFTVPYDFSSVMQYPQWAFSRDVYELNTIITKDPFMQLSLGGDELSFRDKKLANAMYSCDGRCFLCPLPFSVAGLLQFHKKRRLTCPPCSPRQFSLFKAFLFSDVWSRLEASTSSN